MTNTTEQRSPFPWMETNSPAWGAIVEYVTSHSSDIENSINDFGELKPVLDFFNRNVPETDILLSGANGKILRESIKQMDEGEQNKAFATLEQ